MTENTVQNVKQYLGNRNVVFITQPIFPAPDHLSFLITRSIFFKWNPWAEFLSENVKETAPDWHTHHAPYQ
ncbi:hypothetical protein QF042_003599 [Pedobacter sp. W3I1]|nr:hypothetical protein [Pedobacter sp. W3I1]